MLRPPGGSAPAQTTRWSALATAAARVGPGAPPLYLFPLPPDYERALQRRLGMTHELRNKFKQVGPGAEHAWQPCYPAPVVAGLTKQCLP